MTCLPSLLPAPPLALAQCPPGEGERPPGPLCLSAMCLPWGSDGPSASHSPVLWPWVYSPGMWGPGQCWGRLGPPRRSSAPAPNTLGSCLLTCSGRPPGPHLQGEGRQGRPPGACGGWLGREFTSDLLALVVFFWNNCEVGPRPPNTSVITTLRASVSSLRFPLWMSRVSDLGYLLLCRKACSRLQAARLGGGRGGGGNSQAEESKLHSNPRASRIAQLGS